MAAFVTRTLDQSLKRGSPRAALGQWWTSNDSVYTLNEGSGGQNPQYLACDGRTVWCSNTTTNSVSRIDIGTGVRICLITNLPEPEKIVIESGFVFIASFQSPGKIYSFNISQTIDSSAVSQFITTVGNNPIGITWDGQNLWTANVGTGPGTGSISRANLQTFTPTTTTFTVGFSQPMGILFDGANLWVTDFGDASLKRVNTNTGTVVQTIPLSGAVGHPVFDGTNLWIPCTGPDQVYVVRGVGGLTGTILAQLTGNGLNGIKQAAFDGERILVPNDFGQTVSLWRASDLSPIGSVSIISDSTYNPRGVCSDGTSFFIGMKSTGSSNGLIHFF
jgi:hypothetical protein